MLSQGCQWTGQQRLLALLAEQETDGNRSSWPGAVGICRRRGVKLEASRCQHRRAGEMAKTECPRGAAAHGRGG